MATRLVDRNGKLSWKDQKIFLTSSLAGWQVGLQRSEKGPTCRKICVWVTTRDKDGSD